MKKIIILTTLFVFLLSSFAFAEISILGGAYTGLQNVNAGGTTQGTSTGFFGFTFGGGDRYGHESYFLYNKKDGINYINTGGGFLFNIVQTGGRVKVVPYITVGFGTTLSFGTFDANNIQSASSSFSAAATMCVATGVKTFFTEKIGARLDIRMFKPFTSTNSLTNQLNQLAGATTADGAGKANWAVSGGITFKL